MFLILFRNILCPQQKFPSLRSPRNIMSNNVSSFASTLKRDRDIGRKAVLSDAKTTFMCTPALSVTICISKDRVTLRKML